MPSTTRWQLPYPAGTQAPRVPADIGALAGAADSALTVIDDARAAARAQADLALNTARDALEVSVVRAQVVPGNIVTASGAMGSIAVDTTVFARPTSGRTSGSPTRVVAARNGTYSVQGRAAWSGVAAGSGGALGRRYAQIRRNAAGNPSNGTDLSPGYDRPVTDNAAFVIDLHPGMFDMVAGDYIELFVMHTQGSGLAVLGGNGGSFLSLEYIRPLPS